jgi:hypothetical protein
MLDERVVERKLLLGRLFPKTELFQIGKTLGIRYFRAFKSSWDIDDDKAALEISSEIDDEKLEEIFKLYKPRNWEAFRGQYYTFEENEFRLESSWSSIRAAVARLIGKFGKNCVAILKLLTESGEGVDLEKIRRRLPESADYKRILSALENQKVIVRSYEGKQLREWAILEETASLLRKELGLASGVVPRGVLGVAPKLGKLSPLDDERQKIRTMDGDFDKYLIDLTKHRLDETIRFGKDFSILGLAEYLRNLFGPVLFFDSLLSITQQYGLSDVEIVHPEGRTGMRTGWNLSLFGEPGSGKSFAVRDMIMGKSDAKVPPHGIPGRNRYGGGMTPARFIRIGQAYAGRVFNFVIPEFNDWFKYKGMVEPLKLAMERGEIRYETNREAIGPYRFKGFFSVNYNVAVQGESYAVTVQDPNFRAIEDRMLCRLHRLTKRRFVEIAESQLRLAFGEIDIASGSQKIRDHLTLVYAAETGHPLVKTRLPSKPVMLAPKAQNVLTRARKAILEEIPRENVPFSARLENRAIRFASAASLMNYFASDSDYILVHEKALEYAIQLYVEEASVRAKEEFVPESVLARITTL